MSSKAKTTNFVYITAVPLGDASGQNAFETNIVKQFAGAKFGHDDVVTYVFGARLADTSETELVGSRVCLLPLGGKTMRHYLAFQWRLLAALGRFLWSHRRERTIVFMRYHDSMLAPLILHVLFRFTLLMRTGPVLPNLTIHGKNPNFAVYHTIRITLGMYYRRAVKIVTVTKRIKQWVVDTYSVPGEKVVVIPNAVDADVFFPGPGDRKRWGLPERVPVVGFVGYIYVDQGLSTVVRAMAALDGDRETAVHLLVVGDGPEVPSLRQLASELGIAQRVHWTGRVQQAAVRTAINSCDVLLAPFTRRAFQTTGSSALKLYEYLACDKPIIASAAPDHQFIRELGFGELVPAEDVEAWAATLRKVAQWPKSLDNKGREFVLQKHTYAAIATRFIELGLQAVS